MKKGDPNAIIFQSVKDATRKEIARIEERHEAKRGEQQWQKQRSQAHWNLPAYEGISTGFLDIDAETDGLPYGLIGVGARPEDGLTDFGLNLTLHMAEKHKVLHLAPELPFDVITRRMLSIESKVGIADMNKGSLNEERDFTSLTRSAGKLAKGAITLYTDPLTPSSFFAVCQEAQKQKGVQVVVLDRLQRLFPQERRDSFYWEAKETRGMFDTLIKEQGLALIVLSELKKRQRGQELGTDALRDFGTLEYDASPLILLEGKPHENGEERVYGAREMMVKVTNNLRGTLNFTTALNYFQIYGRFENAARIDEHEP